MTEGELSLYVEKRTFIEEWKVLQVSTEYKVSPVALLVV